MYAAVPRITPILVIMAGQVMVGDVVASMLPADTGSRAFANPKSSTFTVPSAPELDVSGFEIAMNDALLVRRFQCLGDLLGDGQCLVERNRPLRDTVRERRSLDQLHHERADTVALFEAVDLRDVRMVQ